MIHYFRQQQPPRVAVPILYCPGTSFGANIFIGLNERKKGLAKWKGGFTGTLLLSALLYFLAVPPAFSQAQPLPAAPMQDQASYPISLFQKATASDSHLYNGPEYVDYRKVLREWHQFFEQDIAVPGTVIYDGDIYENVPMLYDLLTDELIIAHDGGTKQKLVPQKVSGFTLHGHTFVRLVVPDTLSHSPLRTGFYDLLLDGNTKMLVKRRKQIKQEKERTIIIEVMIPDEQFFLQNKGAYTKVKTRKSVLKVFEDKRKELKKFARENRLRFMAQREASILALASQYEKLSAK